MEQHKNGKPMSALGAAIMGMTPEEEAAVIAKIKAEADPIADEAELREMLEQWKRGELMPVEQLMRELGIDIM